MIISLHIMYLLLFNTCCILADDEDTPQQANTISTYLNWTIQNHASHLKSLHGLKQVIEQILKETIMPKWNFCIKKVDSFKRLHNYAKTLSLFGPCGDMYYASTEMHGTRQWILNMPFLFGINLTFTRFSMRYSGSECQLDALELFILHQDQQSYFGRFCGSRLPFEIQLLASRFKINLLRKDLSANLNVLAIYQIQDDRHITSSFYFSPIPVKTHKEIYILCNDNSTIDICVQNFMPVYHLSIDRLKVIHSLKKS